MGARAVGKGRPYVLGLTAFGQDCLTSQLPVSRWHEQIGDPTVADGILGRLVHNAHRIEMRRDSMRKSRGKPNA
jgi:DNA replication protein DnaC